MPEKYNACTFLAVKHKQSNFSYKCVPHLYTVEGVIFMIMLKLNTLKIFQLFNFQYKGAYDHHLQITVSNGRKSFIFIFVFETVRLDLDTLQNLIIYGIIHTTRSQYYIHITLLLAWWSIYTSSFTKTCIYQSS